MVDSNGEMHQPLLTERRACGKVVSEMRSVPTYVRKTLAWRCGLVVRVATTLLVCDSPDVLLYSTLD